METTSVCGLAWSRNECDGEEKERRRLVPSGGGGKAFIWWHGSCLGAGHEALPLHAVPCHGTGCQGSTAKLRQRGGVEPCCSSCLGEDGLGQQQTQERQERQPLAHGDSEGQRLAGGGQDSLFRDPSAPQIERHKGSLESEHRIRGSGTLHMIVHGEGASAPAPRSGCSARNETGSVFPEPPASPVP